MIGYALPMRFSRRIKRRANLSLIKASPKKKIRRSPVKKRTSDVNSLFKAKEKTKVGGKNKLVEKSKQSSKFLKQASLNLKPAICKSSRINIPKIHDHNTKTRNSLNASHLNLTNDKGSLKNLEISNSKKVSEKKRNKKILNREKQTLRRSLRLSKSPSSKEKELNHLTPSKEKILGQKKTTKQVTTLSSQLILTPNPEKSTYTSKHSGRKKSSKLSSESRSQETCVNTPAFKSFTVTPLPGKVPRTSRYSGNRKSGGMSKAPNRSRLINSELSLETSSFRLFFETPRPIKHSEKRKSSRLLESSPLRTLNKELSLSTPAPLLTRNPDSTPNKPPKSCKSIELSSSESRSRKQSKPKVSNKDGCTVSDKKRKQKRKVNQRQKTSENFKTPLSNETENLPIDVFTTPPFNPPRGKSISKKYLSKSDSKASKRKLNDSASENQVASEELQDAKKRKKSAGVVNPSSPSKCRSMKSPVKSNRTKKLKNYRNSKDYPMPLMNIQGKMDVLTSNLLEKQSRGRVISMSIREIDCLSTSDERIRKSVYLFEKQSQRKVRSVTCGNKVDCLSSFAERKRKSTGKRKRKSVKRLIPNSISLNVNYALSANTGTEKTIGKKTSVKTYPTKKRKRYERFQVNKKSSPPIKEDCLTANLYDMKHRRAKSALSENDSRMISDGETSPFLEKRLIKTLAPIKFTPNVNLNGESSLPNSIMGRHLQFPIDYLTNGDASCSQNIDRLSVNVLTPCYINKKKTQSWPLENETPGGISAKDDFSKIPARGTLKHKRWLLNNLKEKNGSYEDDIFENQKFELYKQAFHFGDESDGSSVNIATPKFDCILTPALPKKTPRFKDCISQADLLLARKSAEEYQYRRNKKRKSGNKPSSSAKKTSENKKDKVQNIPEKKKLDFEETVNKLIEVQKNLEIEAEAGDELEDSYFSDASN